jgi:hypothetical protein
MSTRLYRCMGWGMDTDTFKKYAKLDDDGADTVYEYLETKLSTLSDEQLTFKPDRVYEALKYGPGDARATLIVQKRLLATKFTMNGKPKAPIGRAEDLWTCIDVNEEMSHIMFFPNLYYRAKWYRWDDDLDFAFEMSQEAGQRECEMLDKLKVMKFGHYPWTNAIMDREGHPLHWKPYFELDKSVEWLPAVPTEIRWYLTEYEILPVNGVNQLRPMAAQYWM